MYVAVSEETKKEALKVFREDIASKWINEGKSEDWWEQVEVNGVIYTMNVHTTGDDPDEVKVDLHKTALNPDTDAYITNYDDWDNILEMLISELEHQIVPVSGVKINSTKYFRDFRKPETVKMDPAPPAAFYRGYPLKGVKELREDLREREAGSDYTSYMTVNYSDEKYVEYKCIGRVKDHARYRVEFVNAGQVRARFEINSAPYKKDNDRIYTTRRPMGGHQLNIYLIPTMSKMAEIASQWGNGEWDPDIPTSGRITYARTVGN